jgi:hypothetical protein
MQPSVVQLISGVFRPAARARTKPSSGTSGRTDPRAFGAQRSWIWSWWKKLDEGEEPDRPMRHGHAWLAGA